jgi:hypothetical protein
MMANKPLTAKEWRNSVQQIWDDAIRDSIQDQIREAVLAEREACAKLCEEEIEKIKPVYSVTTENALKAIRARGQE